MVSTHVINVIAWITTHLPTTERWKAELGWLVDPQRTLSLRSGHETTIDKAQIMESPPAKDRRSNHWATTPTKLGYIWAKRSGATHCICLYLLMTSFPVTGSCLTQLYRALTTSLQNARKRLSRPIVKSGVSKNGWFSRRSSSRCDLTTQTTYLWINKSIKPSIDKICIALYLYPDVNAKKISK